MCTSIKWLLLAVGLVLAVVVWMYRKAIHAAYLRMLLWLNPRLTAFRDGLRMGLRS